VLPPSVESSWPKRVMRPRSTARSSPVIEVEAAYEVLVCLALARVLRHDQTGYGLEQLTVARDRPQAQVGRTDASFRRAHRNAAKVVDFPGDLHGVERKAPDTVARGRPHRVGLRVC